MISAAGILIITADNQALFLLRGDGGDYGRHYCFPGGRLEEGETALEAAKRECIEEIGSLPGGTPVLLTRTQSTFAPEGAPTEAIDFTTFLLRVKDKFEVKQDGEHIGYAWAPIDQPPQPLHPGCDIALQRLKMDELGVAEAIRDGRLTSPQRYQNVSLFAMRVTGTGAAYRKGVDEYVWRDPNIYLNDDFLKRCYVPVIWEHPKKAVLDSKEFSDRVIGNIMLPYIKGDEVWGIARIYDDDAIKMMMAEQLSTSPTVVLGDPSTNTRLTLETGQKLLIEGKPSLIDHLAVCELGVWDKGQEPAGIAAIGDSIMTEEEKKAADAKAKADAEAKAKADASGEKLDRLLTGIDSVMKRMDDQDKKMDAMAARMDAMSSRQDAFESKDKKTEDKKDDAETEDTKEVAKDKRKDSKRKDADDDKDEKKEEKEEKKADAASSEFDKRLGDLERKVKEQQPLQLSDADLKFRSDTQANADPAYQAHGDSAPRPLQGEEPIPYLKRVLKPLKQHSPTWSGVSIDGIADAEALQTIAKQIYADAITAARNPASVPEDQLRAIVTADSTGRRTTSFYGQPRAWMNNFMPPARRWTGFGPGMSKH